MSKQTLAAVLLMLAVVSACTEPNESRPGYLNIDDYDRSCTAHDDCRLVDLCACNCGERCPTDDAVHESEVTRVDAHRLAFRCESPPINALSCAYHTPICVENTCQAESIELPERTAGGPETWDRSCSTNAHCRAVWAKRCAVYPECTGELYGVARGEEWKANAWSHGCDVLEGAYTEDCQDRRFARTEASCVSGVCEAMIVSPEAPAAVDCSTLSTDGRECLENGCSEFIIRGATIEDDMCVPDDVIRCVSELDQSVTDDTPAYDLDGVAFHWPYPEPPPGAEPCEPNPTVACECLPYD